MLRSSHRSLRNGVRTTVFGVNGVAVRPPSSGWQWWEEARRQAAPLVGQSFSYVQVRTCSGATWRPDDSTDIPVIYDEPDDNRE